MTDRGACELQFIELRQDATHVPVDALAHRQRGAGHRNRLQLGIPVSHFGIHMRELLEEAVGNLHRGVRSVERQIAKERAILVPGDELHGVVGQIVGDVAFAADQLAVVIELGVEILSPVSGSETVVFVEAAGVRMIGKLRPVMLLAKSAGGVASRLESLGNGHFIQVQPRTPPLD